MEDDLKRLGDLVQLATHGEAFLDVLHDSHRDGILHSAGLSHGQLVDRLGFHELALLAIPHSEVELVASLGDGLRVLGVK